jgi:DNA helicase HerA-like ATPase
VFFFDEAHLLFNDAPKALLDKIEQVVRLVRSKGVGVYFVTQNPADIPDTVLGQLGNRVQHALRAFTPRDQKAVKVAATTMRANPKLNLETVIGELGVGEALVSLLDAKGTPGVTERAWVLAPASRIGPVTDDERKQLVATSLVAGTYEKAIDRESAYEKLRGRVAPAGNGGGNGGTTAQEPTGGAPGEEGGWLGTAGEIFGSLTKGTGKTGRGDSILESMAKSAARTVGSQVGRELIRGVLGSLLGGGKKK